MKEESEEHILSNYGLAFDKYGRPVGVFEKDRERPYNAMPVRRRYLGEREEL